MSKYRIRLILAVIFLVLFGVIAALVLSGILGGVESWMYERLSKRIRAAVTGAFKIFTHSASVCFVITALAVLTVVPVTRRKYGFPAALTAGISALINIVLKLIFMRERPDVLRLVEETGQSFPSGHTQSGTAFYIALGLLVLQNIRKLRYRIPLFSFAVFIPFVIGISRIYLGVHYFGDVLGGWTLGAGIAILVNLLWDVLKDKSKSHPKLHSFLFDS